MQRFHDYIQALEVERRKIHVFRRELPLCIELVTQAIETCKQQLWGTTTECCNLRSQSECSEKTSVTPVFEEFIPPNRATSPSDDEQESRSNKSDWLRSAKLWNQTPDPVIIKEDSPRKVDVTEVGRNRAGGGCGGGAFHSLKKETSNNGSIVLPPALTSSAAETDGSCRRGGNGKEKGGGEGGRKSRRCWSPELHRRFLLALQQLGGSHAATPKQIREMMKVDGLTNDEVKSHLQKYRLHTRRPSPWKQENNNSQAPQFVVVGGLWAPREDTADIAASSNGMICTAVADLPPPFQEPPASSQWRQQSNSDERSGPPSDQVGLVRSPCPPESSSADTETTWLPSS